MSMMQLVLEAWWCPFGVRDEAISVSLRGLRLLSFTSTRRYLYGSELYTALSAITLPCRRVGEKLTPLPSRLGMSWTQAGAMPPSPPYFRGCEL